MLICVSLLQVVLGLTIKEATVLSQAAISGGALSGALFSVFRSHPTDSRAPLLDFRMALVLMPVLLLGTSVGKFFSKALCLPALATFAETRGIVAAPHQSFTSHLRVALLDSRLALVLLPVLLLGASVGSFWQP